MAALGNLIEERYKLTSFPDRWLDCDITHQVQIYLREIDLVMEGFQRPTLDRCRSFNIVPVEF